MKKEIYLISSAIIIFSSPFFAKDAAAILAPNINIETENIHVLTTVTPSPTTTITIKPVNKTPIRVLLKKTNAIKEIDRRLASLEKLSGKINSIKRLTATQRETLLAQVQIEVTKLTELKTKINAETDATTLQEQKKSITESYKIYALFIPKIEIMAHADKIIEIADAMKVKTDDAALISKISDAKTKAQSAYDLVFPLVPEDYPDYKITLKTARDLLRTARTSLNDVFSTLKSAM